MDSTTDVSKPRRGLVLAGGGAKGAYEYGCLIAFKEMGITFDAVAGTSVGALNAALWSTNQVEAQKEIWTNMRQKSVYLIRVTHLLFWWLTIYKIFIDQYLDYMSSSLGLIGQYLRPVSRVSILLYELYNLCWYVGITFLIGLTFFTATDSIYTMMNKWGALSRIWVLWIPAILIYLTHLLIPDVLKSSLTRRIRFHYWSIVFWSVSLFFVLAVCVIDINGQFNIVRYRSHFSVWVNLLIVIFFLHPLILFALYKIALLSNVSILDTSPLRTIIARTCRKRFQIPTFITVTKRDTTTDPDILSLTNRSVMTRPGVEVKQWAISGKRIYVQEYLRIDGLAEKDRIEGLMASSALPLGIFPGIKMKGVWYADGGVVDNIPIYPLISLFPCEELFVIQLEPLPKKANGLEDIYKTNWQIHHQRLEGVKFYKDVMDRCAILTKNSVPKDVARNEIQAIVKQAKEQSNLSNEENLAFQAIDNWPRRIITIAPEKNYGFWNGTLNFNAKFTRRLIRKGRRDAYRILKQDMN